jgi:hypothetical protein
MAGQTKKSSTAKSKRDYTFSVYVSFTMQGTFSGKEVHPAKEGGEDDVEPTEKALAALADRVKECLSQDFVIDDIDAWADYDQLLAISEVVEDDSAPKAFLEPNPGKSLKGHKI